MARILFLSHAGIDTGAAKALKARLLAAPAAQQNRLSVWFDKDDLAAGQLRHESLAVKALPVKVRSRVESHVRVAPAPYAMHSNSSL